MVSGSISPGSPPCFSPFPHGTGSLLVRLSIQPWPVSLACFPQGSLSPWYLRKISRSVKLFSFTGLLPSLVALSRDIQLTKLYLSVLPRIICIDNKCPDDNLLQPRNIECSSLGSCLFPRRYSGNKLRFLFLRLLRCFTSAGTPSRPDFASQLIGDAFPSVGTIHLLHRECFLFLYFIQKSLKLHGKIGAGLFGLIIQTGFPIRKSPDQRLVATSPRLIADTPRPSSPQPPEASTIRS
jgi:hypothetical protein